MKLESVLITKIIIYYVVSSITNNTSDSSSHHYILLGQKSWAGRGGVCVVVISLLQKDKMIWRNDSDWFVSHSSDKASLQSQTCQPASFSSFHLRQQPAVSQSSDHHNLQSSHRPVRFWHGDSRLSPSQEWMVTRRPRLTSNLHTICFAHFYQKKTSCKFGINLSVASN